MRREFGSRDELIAYVAGQFPEAAERDDHVPEARGGRAAAEEVLARIEPDRYAATRNHLGGKVTRLGPYIRYGILSLAEVRAAALAKVLEPGRIAKFVQELAWRDYWQRLYAQLGGGIWEDRGPYKTGFGPEAYAEELPADIERGATGLVCIDSFSRELRETGYLHNHARLWMAAYMIHWRRIRWRAGARWFLEHLLCGDPASNNLSWQWVASTGSHKPYYFNRENLEKHTDGAYCRVCPLYGHCDFEGAYDELALELFPNGAPVELADPGGPFGNGGRGGRSDGKRGRR